MVYDLSADEMVAAVDKFSNSSSSKSIAALAVLSHGNLQGDICGNDLTSSVTVQRLVDGLCHSSLDNVPKVNEPKILLLVSNITYWMVSHMCTRQCTALV